jgi:hypothetical protein
MQRLLRFSLVAMQIAYAATLAAAETLAARVACTRRCLSFARPRPRAAIAKRRSDAGCISSPAPTATATGSDFVSVGNGHSRQERVTVTDSGRAAVVEAIRYKTMIVRLLLISSIVAIGFARSTVAADIPPPPPVSAGANHAPGACNACVESTKGDRVCYPIACSSMPNPSAITERTGVNRTCSADGAPNSGQSWCYVPRGGRVPAKLFHPTSPPHP